MFRTLGSSVTLCGQVGANSLRCSVGSSQVLQAEDSTRSSLTCWEINFWVCFYKHVGLLWYYSIIGHFMSLSATLHSFFSFSYIVNVYLRPSKHCFVIVSEGQHTSFNDCQVSWSKFWKVILNTYYILLLCSNCTWASWKAQQYKSNVCFFLLLSGKHPWQII